MFTFVIYIMNSNIYFYCLEWRGAIYVYFHPKIYRLQVYFLFNLWSLCVLNIFSLDQYCIYFVNV